MGKVTSEHQKETPTHFSHPHPLTLITTDHNHLHQQHPYQTLVSSSCAGCNLNVSGTNFYTCTVCSFFLHKKCFEMPMKITHPFHKEHTLALLPKPAYSTAGVFNCDACFEPGKGFSYSCEPCGIDLHILCASTPLSVTNATCHPHKLDLAFGSPYDTKNFSCDVCKKIGGDHWLYRCGLCGFDAHLTCARPQINNHSGGTRDRSIHVPQPQPAPVQQSFVHHRDYYHPYYYHPNMSPHVVPYGYPAGGPVAAVDGQNQMLFQGFQQIAQGSQAVTQTTILSGGLGGGDRGSVHQLMPVMYELNNYVGIPGGVGADIFQSWLGNINGIDFPGGGALDFIGGFLP
ncbi:hypothetical protein ABFS83_02G126800 [Erythranthe nasuta]